MMFELKFVFQFTYFGWNAFYKFINPVSTREINELINEIYKVKRKLLYR